jgi:hypothetical protein
MTKSLLFWLHIKKSAGITIRDLLKPHYVETDRENFPISFIQADTIHYNDIVNNYRTPFGKYYNKRALFAKRFLYKDHWDRLYKLVFAREPISRTKSMFYYLFWKSSRSRHDLSTIGTISNYLKITLKTKKFLFDQHYAFDAFLDLVEMSHATSTVYSPLNLEFVTHVTPMYDDITDSNGNFLIDNIYKLENLRDGILDMHQKLSTNYDPRLLDDSKRLNSRKLKLDINLHKSQILKIKKLFNQDFQIYENAK